jgi:crotonobetainyl-CoA:carnitine CoA-transferase CaiB-like acyl-CoA transferase
MAIERDKPDTDPTLPLAGLRIVDISNVFSLPYATGLLTDLGAEVIKIEGPGRVDVTRGGAFSGVFPENVAGDDPWNRSSTFNLLNRGKKSVALDLRRPEGRAVLKDLIRVSDMLMENFTPRVMRGWELDFPNAQKLNPNLIMVSCSGYGPHGPFAQYPAQATTQEATHGLAHVTGYPGDVPSKAGQSFVDFLATWAVVMGTTLALRYRHRFGKGLWVDVAMYQLGCSMVSERIMDWEANQRLGERIGNRHPWLAPQGCYRCAGKDQWCVLSVHDDTEWAALCNVLDQPDLATDARFASNDARMRNHDAIDAIIATWMADVGKFDAMHRLQSAGVRAGAVFDARDMHLDPHMKSRDFLETVQFPAERGIGKRPILGRPWRLNRTPLSVRGPAPMLGEHNRDVLQGLLGYDDSQFAGLQETGVIGTVPTNPRPVLRMSMDERVERGRLAYWDSDFKQRLGIDD